MESKKSYLAGMFREPFLINVLERNVVGCVIRWSFRQMNNEVFLRAQLQVLTTIFLTKFDFFLFFYLCKLNMKTVNFHKHGRKGGGPMGPLPAFEKMIDLGDPEGALS